MLANEFVACDKLTVFLLRIYFLNATSQAKPSPDCSGAKRSKTQFLNETAKSRKLTLSNEFVACDKLAVSLLKKNLFLNKAFYEFRLPKLVLPTNVGIRNLKVAANSLQVSKKNQKNLNSIENHRREN